MREHHSNMRKRKYILCLLILAAALVNFPLREASGDSHPKKCPVHHLRLKNEKLEVVYGLVAHPCAGLERLEFAARMFSYANSVVDGGCVMEPDSPPPMPVVI